MSFSKLENVKLRRPSPIDGYALHRFVSDNPALDENSIYCNILQCSHFADSSIVAYFEDQLIGFVSGYIRPGFPDRLFVWQVGVSADFRSSGLASKMISEIFLRPLHHSLRFIEATITADNTPSWALFNKLAKQFDADIHSIKWLDKDRHFNGEHSSEDLVVIGPI